MQFESREKVQSLRSDLPVALQGIERFAMNQAADPTGGDTHTSAYAEALVASLAKDTQLSASLERAVEKRQLDSRVAFYLSQRVFQYFAVYESSVSSDIVPSIGKNGTVLTEQKPQYGDFPNNFDKPETWLNLFELVMENPRKKDWFEFVMGFLNVQTTVAQRSAISKLVIQSHYERFSAPPRVLVFGCSRNHELLMMQEGPKHGITYSEIDVVHDVESESTDVETSESINALVNQPLELGQSLGVDVWPQGSNLDLLSVWPRMCFRPEELKGSEVLERYDKLESLPWPDNIKYKDVDKNSMGSLTDTPGEKKEFDIALIPTVFYMLNKKEREDKLSEIIKHMSPNGIIVVIDAARRDPKNPSNLVFPSGGFDIPYMYSAFEMDVATGSTFNTLSSRDSRVTRIFIRPEGFALRALIARQLP